MNNAEKIFQSKRVQNVLNNAQKSTLRQRKINEYYKNYTFIKKMLFYSIFIPYFSKIRINWKINQRIA